MAYVAGLIASDGCMSKDGRHVALTSVDTEVLVTTKNILKKAITVARIASGAGLFAYRIQISDVSLYRFLFEAGLRPAKSKTIHRVDVPDDLYADFLRGEFDGDGSIWGYKDARWRNSYMYYTSFVSASDPYLIWLQRANCRLAGTTSASLQKYQDPRVGMLRYAKADTILLFRFMYYRPGLPKLTRKHRKFIELLSSDPYNTEVTSASGGTADARI